MKQTVSSAVVPDPAWKQPAKTWLDVIDRYVLFLQVPAWRVSLKRDGSEKPPCLNASAAQSLGKRMRKVISRLADSHGVKVDQLAAVRHDLLELSGSLGRHIPLAKRCPTRLYTHLQRAYLLNEAGYRCEYCGRTAWGVYSEAVDGQPARTLRFEIDHRIPRRKLKPDHQFDPENLVAACRSCNAIKAESSQERFIQELQSLSLGFIRSKGIGVV